MKTKTTIGIMALVAIFTSNIYHVKNNSMFQQRSWIQKVFANEDNQPCETDPNETGILYKNSEKSTIMSHTRCLSKRITKYYFKGENVGICTEDKETGNTTYSFSDGYTVSDISKFEKIISEVISTFDLKNILCNTYKEKSCCYQKDYREKDCNWLFSNISR